MLITKKTWPVVSVRALLDYLDAHRGPHHFTSKLQSVWISGAVAAVQAAQPEDLPCKHDSTAITAKLNSLCTEFATERNVKLDALYRNGTRILDMGKLVSRLIKADAAGVKKSTTNPKKEDQQDTINAEDDENESDFELVSKTGKKSLTSSNKSRHVKSKTATSNTRVGEKRKAAELDPQSGDSEAERPATKRSRRGESVKPRSHTEYSDAEIVEDTGASDGDHRGLTDSGDMLQGRPPAASVAINKRSAADMLKNGDEGGSTEQSPKRVKIVQSENAPTAAQTPTKRSARELDEARVSKDEKARASKRPKITAQKSPATRRADPHTASERDFSEDDQPSGSELRSPKRLVVKLPFPSAKDWQVVVDHNAAGFRCDHTGKGMVEPSVIQYTMEDLLSKIKVAVDGRYDAVGFDPKKPAAVNIVSYNENLMQLVRRIFGKQEKMDEDLERIRTLRAMQSVGGLPAGMFVRSVMAAALTHWVFEDDLIGEKGQMYKFLAEQLDGLPNLVHSMERIAHSKYVREVIEPDIDRRAYDFAERFANITTELFPQPTIDERKTVFEVRCEAGEQRVNTDKCLWEMPAWVRLWHANLQEIFIAALELRAKMTGTGLRYEFQFPSVGQEAGDGLHVCLAPLAPSVSYYEHIRPKEFKAPELLFPAKAHCVEMKRSATA